jgi:hypothetical protein
MVLALEIESKFLMLPTLTMMKTKEERTRYWIVRNRRWKKWYRNVDYTYTEICFLYWLFAGWLGGGGGGGGDDEGDESKGDDLMI